MTAPSPEQRMNGVAHRFRAYSDRRRKLAGTVGELRPQNSSGAPVGTTTALAELRDRLVGRHRLAASPFDDLIAAVSKGPVERSPPAVPPPASRFMVRVASLGRPHRATKRNYDYFDELNAALAAREAEPRIGPEKD